MLLLYLFALIVGGGLLVFSLLGGHDTHGGDVGHVGHVGHGAHHGDDNPIQWLSLRTVTYFLFVFGGVGAVLSWSWHNVTAPLVLLLAASSGVGVAAAAAASFGYLRKTDSGEPDSDDSFVGLTGRVTLPIGSAGTGKVLVHRGDRSYELLARPFDKVTADAAKWKSVIVVEMNQGTALVAPLEDPALQESSS
jgi:membrane protein implicated in regulation of membrane protease activity